MSPDVKLVYNANQIAKFFQHRPQEQAVADTADHLKKYWDPRMRDSIIALLNKGGEGFDPIVRKAVEWIATDARYHHAYPAAVEGEE
ncbi:MAG TPA: formate dehydrogenase subunit delta [Stellaceae bacterium]